MSKSGDTSHIDFENGVLYGKLKQIRQQDKQISKTKPDLMSVWCYRIKPQDSKKVLAVVNSHFSPIDGEQLLHVKRFQKITDGEVKLDMLLCLYKSFGRDDIVSIFHEHGSMTIEDGDLRVVDVPSDSPSTREVALAWGAEFWPIAWKGNPNHQFLKKVDIDIEEVQQNINQLLANLEDKALPFVTLFDGSHRVISHDCRTDHPLHHSVMRGIQMVADQEKEIRTTATDGNYLLNKYTIYTTYEPCVMCCMALVHSRIDRVIYLQPLPTGGFESNYQLGARDGLNWKFEVWRWLSDPQLPPLDNKLNA